MNTLYCLMTSHRCGHQAVRNLINIMTNIDWFFEICCDILFISSVNYIQFSPISSLSPLSWMNEILTTYANTFWFIWARCKNIGFSFICSFNLNENKTIALIKYISINLTWRKQLVVCPIPTGSILSRNIAFIVVLFPLLVLNNKV